MSIKVLKMVTGEQVIGHVVDRKDSDGNNIGFTLSYPYCVVLRPITQPDETLKFDVNYVAWMGASATQSFPMPYTSVIAIGEPQEEIVVEYISKFGDLIEELDTATNS
jgi:hypothetical protein